MTDFHALRRRIALRAAFVGAAAALLFTIGASAGQLPSADRPALTARSTSADPARVSPKSVADALTVSARTVAPDASGRYLTIVRFVDQPLASYDGGVAGLPATSNRITGANRLDARSPAALAYLQYLEQRQAAHAADLGRLLGRQIELEQQYLGALNGAAVRLTLDEARRVRDMDFVIGAHLDEERELQTDVGPEHIGAPVIWFGQTSDMIATRGEGVIVGVIDTGINFSHPSFAATDGDGYSHTNPYGAGVYQGWCADNPGFCNEKLVAAYGFNPVGGSPVDDNNHGSHVASTAAGNVHVADFDVGGDNYLLEISGVAPRANIVAYRVCAPGCPNTASLLAIDSAIVNDQVDVLNYSISGNDFPWDDPVDLAFLDAFNAGIFVAASAGNAGPGTSTVAKTGPWNAAVAASTHRRVIGNTLDVTGPTSPAELQGVLAVPGEDMVIGSDIVSELRYNDANPLGCNPGHPADFFDGVIALVSRGGCTFSEKINNAVAAGATNVIVFNSVGGPPIIMGGVSGLPASVMMDNFSGIALRDYVQDNAGTTIRLNAGTALIENVDWQDVIAGFSSRGPSQYDLLAPTFTAPGVNILAAGFDGAGDYAFLQGTSMSSPHAAGAAALMTALRPGWSPAEIRSALALTAVPDVLTKEDGLTPADPFDQGSGLLNLAAAGDASVVMNESGANFAAANPATGGDPRTLNIPHLVDQDCRGECSFQRNFRSVSPDTIDYVVETSAPAGITVSVTPDVFTLAPGADIDLLIEVTVDEDIVQFEDWYFGEIRLVPPGNEIYLQEDFSDESFPPAGWSSFWLQGLGTQQWQRTTDQSNSAPASAHRRFGGSADEFQDDWLVTPSLGLNADENVVLSFADRGQWMGDYEYAGVLASTGSCDPVDGDFVELREIDDSLTNIWRAVPAIDLSAYAGQNLCLAFRYSGTFAHSWWIDDVVVTSVYPPAQSASLPLAIIPRISTPLIEVVPDSIATLAVIDGPPIVVNMQIHNPGGSDLDWQIEDAGSVDFTVWHQPVNGSSGIVSDFFIGSDAGAYSASDFVLERTTSLSHIFAAGFDNTNSLSAQPAINWHVYADDDGVPAGHPEDGTEGASALWTYTAAPNAPGVDITNNDIALDLTAAGQALNLPAGTYWLSVFPSYNVTGAGGARWNWYQAAQVGPQTQLVSPAVFSVADWTSLSALGVAFTDTAFTLDASGSCGSPWLSTSVTSGTVGLEDFVEVSVMLDPDGLALGIHEAYLCITSNAANEPVVVVPVTVNVVADEVFEDRFESP
jgi:subtilisin family serine protease